MPEEPEPYRQNKSEKKPGDVRDSTNAKPTDRPAPVDPTRREGAPRVSSEPDEEAE